MQKNKNRPGYKKTKVGWIPMDWDCCRLRSVAEVVRGGSPRPARSPLYFNGDFIPWITVAELTNNNGAYLNKTATCLTEAGSKHSRIFEEGSLLLANSGATLGVPKITRIRACANDGIAGFTHLSDEAYKLFLYYFLSSKTRYLRECLAPGVGQPNLNTELIGALRAPLPSLPEQEAIAEVLECWDKAIRGYERKIEKKRNIKKGLMQRLLTGKQRLPGFATTENTEGHGKKKDGIPVGWKEVRLGGIGCVVTGNTPPKKNLANYGNEYCWATAEDFINKYITDTNLKLSEQGKDQARMLPAGSVLVTCIASIGLNAIAKVPMATNQQINAIIVDTRNFSNEFVYYLVSKNKQYLQRAAGSGAVPILSKGEFEKIQMFFPPLPEQQAIVTVLSSADSEIAALDRKLASLREQKRFLLNNMVTGTIRLPQFATTEHTE